MKHKRKYLFFIGLFFCITTILQAQDTTKVKKNIFSYVPINSFHNGLRFDYERQLRLETNWIVFSPQVYFGQDQRESTSIKNSYDAVYGGGIEVYHKHFHDNRAPMGAYVMYGAKYNYFWVSFPSSEGSLPISESINRIGANIQLGVQYGNLNYFIFDIYMGLGVRYSFIEPHDNEVKNYSDAWWDYGYRGVLLTGGVRIGIPY